MYEQEKARSVVTFKLDASMSNYIDTLVNRMKALVVKDLKTLIGDSEPSDAVMQAVIASNFGGNLDYDKD